MKSLRRALLPALPVLVTAVAGCGGSSGSAGDADPASFLPASVPFYAEVVVRPDDEQRGEVEAAIKKVLGTDHPGGELVKLIDRLAKEDGPDLTYAADIEPWLGDRIGIAVTSVRGEGDTAIAIASKDDDKARQALAKAKGDFVDREYGGVDYRFDRKDESAYAVVDHAVLAGTEPGLKAAIDASKGDSLAESDRLKSAREKVSDERLGLLYVDVQGLLRAVSAATASDPQTGALLQAFSGSLPRTLVAAVDVDADAIEVEALSIGTPRSASTGHSGADALAALPASAWLGLGVGDLGGTLDRTLTQLASGGGLAGVGIQALLGQVEQQVGLNLRRDVLSWIGDAGVFVAGESGADLHGGLIVESKDPAATRRTLEKLEGVLAGTGSQVDPLRAAGVDIGYTVRAESAPPIYVALAGEKFVVAVGPKALRAAIGSGASLGSSPELEAAASKLGAGLRPSFFLSLPQVTQLLASLAGDDPGFAQARRYLDAFGALVAGAKDEGGGVTRARIVATLR